MRTLTISKWGNSTAIRIPKTILIKFNLSEGDSLSLVEDETSNKLVFQPIRKQEQKKKIRNRYRLADLMPKDGKLAKNKEWDLIPATNKEISL